MKCFVTTLIAFFARLPGYSVRVQYDSIAKVPAAAGHPDRFVGRAMLNFALVAVMSTMLLAACGGGGGNDNATTTVPLQAAFANETDHGYTATGTGTEANTEMQII